MWALFGLALGVLVTVTVAHLREEHPWNPLGPYRDQHVLTPVVPFGADVLVAGVEYRDGRPTPFGTKCTSETVTVKTTRAWRTTRPVGSHIPTAQAVSTRSRGCEPKPTYRNQVPEAVLVRVAALCKTDGSAPVWRLTGEDTPIRPGGERGIPHVWRTGEFTIDCPLGA